MFKKFIEKRKNYNNKLYFYVNDKYLILAVKNGAYNYQYGCVLITYKDEIKAQPIDNIKDYNNLFNYIYKNNLYINNDIEMNSSIYFLNENKFKKYMENDLIYDYLMEVEK